MHLQPKIRVLVLGASFAGIEAATEAARLLGDRGSVTVIDQSDYFLFRPSLPWVIFDRRRPAEITVPLSPLLRRRGVEFVHDRVVGIDPKANFVATRKGAWPYDYLVIALGSTAPPHALASLARHGFSPMWLEETIRLRDALRQFRGGHIVFSRHPGSSLLCPAYESVFQLVQYLRERGLRERTRITFISDEERPYQVSGAAGSRYVERWLQREGIRFVKSNFVEEAGPGYVRLSDGETLPADIFVFLPPNQGPDVVKQVRNLTDAGGFVLTNRHMQTHAHVNVYAAGDIVAFPGPKSGLIAETQGRIAARNIAADYGIGEPEEFHSSFACLTDLGSRRGLFVYRKAAPQQGTVRTYITLPGILPYLAKGLLEHYFLRFRLRP